MGSQICADPPLPFKTFRPPQLFSGLDPARATPHRHNQDAPKVARSESHKPMVRGTGRVGLCMPGKEPITPTAGHCDTPFVLFGTSPARSSNLVLDEQAGT